MRAMRPEHEFRMLAQLLVDMMQVDQVALLMTIDFDDPEVVVVEMFFCETTPCEDDLHDVCI